MGHIISSSSAIDESTRVIDSLLSSKITQFLTGSGLPVLATLLTLDQMSSTVTPGLETVDDIYGPNSGCYWHRVDGFPFYGLSKDLAPDLNQGEGGVLDYNIELEVTVPPNTLKPKPYDFIYYRFGANNERSILFMITNVTVSSIRSNYFCRCNIKAFDIDDINGIWGKLLNHVTKTFKVDLELVGTQEACVIEDTAYDEIKSVGTLFQTLLSNYIDTFYNARYNCIILRNGYGEYPMYDPYLTKYLIGTHLFEYYTKYPITLVDIDDIPGQTRAEYNKTFYRAVELKKASMLNSNLKWAPVPFSRTVITPFEYYADETVFKVGIYEDTANTKNQYMNYPLIEMIKGNEPDTPFTTVRERIIKNYFTKSDISDVITQMDLDELDNIQLEYTDYEAHILPVVLAILNEYKGSKSNSSTTL